MSEVTPKFKMGDRIRCKFNEDGYSFQDATGRLIDLHAGDMLTISSIKIGSIRHPSDVVYGFAEDKTYPSPNWLGVEENFELAIPNWKKRLGGIK